MSVIPRTSPMQSVRGFSNNSRRVEAPLSEPPPHDDPTRSEETSAGARFRALFNAADPALLERYFGDRENESQRSAVTNRIGSFLVKLSQNSELRESLDVAMLNFDDCVDDSSKMVALDKVKEFLQMEKRAQAAFRAHRERFPTAIWHCCTNLCFATIATDPLQCMLFNELILIHDYANRFHAENEKLQAFLDRRRRGIGTSTVAFVAASREEREAISGERCSTGRERSLREFANFVMEVLPFLYGQADAPSGTARPNRKLCTQAICYLLGVSRNFLYIRKTMQRTGRATDEELASLIDTAGLRLRQRRRNGDRSGYPPLESLHDYNCGCFMPCFAAVPQWTLVSEYNEFIKIARELKPRHKENRFLLNRLFCPLSNSTTRVCNRAISALYTVSESLIADVRRVLDAMCADPSLHERPLVSDGSLRYRYDRNHPLNRYPDAIREKVESHLDIVLRADPAGWNGASVCRVYSPEINTQEKLRKVLGTALEADDSVEADLSASTLQRMVRDYLRRRNYSAISFTQSDHNACPNCKTLQYAVLQYHHEAVVMKRELEDLSLRPRPFSESDQEHFDMLSGAVKAKMFQEDECVNELKVHNARDARIRDTVKKLSDHFRQVENKYRAISSRRVQPQDPQRFDFSDPVEWNLFPDRACLVHQDDMSKLDLPHFVESASSDITRWRFDVNAHVSSVTNDGVVLSHEQGTGPKNASSIVEEILMNHLLSCRGESIKIIVSDNAAVGKNWITTIALPQYMVDQGLAEIVLVVFLENNHGKWLADMLFGQFQSRRRREVLFGIDDMLSGFESINRKSGKVEGFAVNPLGSIDFATVLASLGYETKPPADFGFVKRNIHFACACVPGAKNRLPVELRGLLGAALPDDPGMVRVSSEPPGRTQCQLRFEDRYFDVPAARQTRSAVGSSMGSAIQSSDEELDVPVVIPLYISYSPSGNGVVSTRTAEHVGYNGIEFRKLNACPEMRDTSKPLIRRAWPQGLLEMHVRETGSDEPVAAAESVKCAPLNWLVRRPVRHFCRTDLDWKARYPPRNLLNAKFRKGPREHDPWVPTASYSEPPFPIIDGTAACAAMKTLSVEHQDIRKSLHFLHALRAVYREMGDRDGVQDQWLQRIATVPSSVALERYREEVKLHVERESGHPKGAKSLRQVFKEDEQILSEVARLMSNHSVSGAAAKTLRTQTLTRLFDEAEKTPGALDRFYHLIGKDQERYANELKYFKQKQQQFDKDHGLLPVE